jgi:hypothetical protein
MSGKAQRPPEGKPWSWTTLELIESDAWRSRGINTIRLVDFLLREHMRHGGAENGKLKAPYDQLEVWGIGARYVAPAIAEADELGLVDCHRNGMKVASTYGLTWLPDCNGNPPSDRWRTYRKPALRPPPVPKSRNLPSQRKVGPPSQGKVDARYLPSEGKVDRPKSLPSQGKDLSRRSYQARGNSTDVSNAEPQAETGVGCPAPQVNGAGHYPAGKPSSRHNALTTRRNIDGYHC